MSDTSPKASRIAGRIAGVALTGAVAVAGLAPSAFAAPALAAGTLEHPITTVADPAQVRYGTVAVDGLNIAYREAGDASLPKLVLLHGWPSSSHQFRDMIPLLARRFHVIAPDYQGFGNSDAPDPASYAYSFEGISRTIERFLAAKGFDHYGLFVQDYGGPVGFRIVSRHPAALDWLVVQNSNAYEEGFSPAWDGFRNALWVNRNAETEKPLAAFNTPEGIKGVYLAGAGHPELVSPDAWLSDSAFVARPNNLRIQLDLFYDYRTNPPLYPAWQKLLRDRQPKTVIFWGQHDPFFLPAGGEAFLRDLPKAEMHRLNAGHFATEDNLPYIVGLMIDFYDRQVATAR